MNPYKTKKMAKLIALIIVIAMVITSFSFIAFLPMLGFEGTVVYAAEKDDQQYLESETDTLQSLIRYIQKNYKDAVTTEQLVNGAFDGVINSLGDPYSVYYKTEAESSEFEDAVSGTFSGIGVVLQETDGQCEIVSTMAESPAEEAGIMAGSIIIKVDGKDTTGMNLLEVVDLLRGQENTVVNIAVSYEGQTSNFALKRQMIKTTAVNYKMLDNNIGYIQITSFDMDANLEFSKAKENLLKKGAVSFIIDIRNNPGGFINTAAEIADQLMPEGYITHLVHQGETVETISASGNTKDFYPTVLLINGGSASSSEILAGALKDNDAATLVGTTTFGKGVAQQVVSVSKEAKMKLSMYYFLTPNKETIDHVGITPDYTVENAIGVDTDTLKEIYSQFAPMIEKVKPKKGDTGLNVYGAQQRLLLIGYNVDVNGVMDDKTVSAVRKFQSEEGLNPYGVLDYTTMKKIEVKTLSYINGITDDKDLQLEEAIKLIKEGKVSKLK
ncbi:S41 family peptidase [Anaerovorax odorimutans]|uniref:S41 family peptidase n=1 Tax=Anaerovorax odorimutans TaxID=109327 RepID=UPI0003FF9BC1|nr:S41 family peptidase [Anaerovorax odorimutans]